MAKEIDKSLGDEKTRAGKQRAEGGEDTGKSLGDSRTQLGGLGEELAGLEEELELVDLAARYEIEGPIGQGGMGEVLLAMDRRLKRKVAIKRVRGELARNRAALGRFLTEARAVAALAHNNIVQLYDYGRDAQGPFMVMEYVDGGSLLEKCRSGALPLEEAVELTCQLCDGLARAHDAGIIHRDIKPANILLTKDGTAKLTDFGLAKGELTDASLTMTGAVLGTLDFMPPEQRRDVTLTDARSDLWSLAATLYQMVTGESPKVIRINRVPQQLRELLDKALEETKEARFQSAREFKESLRGCLAGEVAPQLELGSCPACSTRNETSRRFCKKCALPLLVGCLGCQEKISLWEEVCDQCGAKQGLLLEQRREVMAAERATAERLLAAHDFEGAAKLATRLGEGPDPRLWQLRGWSEKFHGQIEATRVEQVAKAEQLVVEALAHEQASDFPASIHALEQIPGSLSQLRHRNQLESAIQILQRVQSKQAECARLEKLIKDRIANRQLNGLEAEVEQLLRLRPDKSDVVRLKEKLLVREAKLRVVRDEAFQAAKRLAEEHEYESALEELSRIDDHVTEPAQVSLRRELEEKVEEIRRLAKKISMARSKNDYPALPRLVQQFLVLRPRDDEMHLLLEQLKVRDAENAASAQACLENARQLRNRGDFEAAVGMLSTIQGEWQTVAGRELLQECSELAEQRQRAMKTLQRSVSSSKFGAANKSVDEYGQRISRAEIVDEQFAGLLNRYQMEREQHERSEAQRKKFNQQIKIGSLAAGVLLLLGVVSYFAISASMRSAAIKRAVAAGDYEAVLRLDASNSEGLALKASAEAKAKAEAISRALAAGNYEEVLRLDASNSEGLALKAKAEAISQALATGNFEEVLRLDPRNREGLALKSKMEAEAKAKAEAISRALAAGDYEAVLRLDAFNSEGLALRAKAEAISRALATGNFEEVLRLDPKNREGLALKSKMEAEAKAKAEAISRALAAGDYEAVLRLDASKLPAEAISKLPLPAEAISKLPAEAVLKLPPFKNSIGLELKLLPAGVFTMGSSVEGDETPHQVTLTRPFYLGVYEVTQEQYERVMGSNPSDFKGPRNPVEMVSWEDAVEFCRKLSALPEEKATGRVYRLPTEAEWEYACRAGSTTKYSFGDNDSQLGDHAWFDRNSDRKTHPVGERKPNAWGLYDMHGNVWEWCSDWYGDYPKGAVSDPVGPSKGSGRVFRGGSWFFVAADCRSAYRSGCDPSYRSLSFGGFRVALSSPEIPK